MRAVRWLVIGLALLQFTPGCAEEGDLTVLTVYANLLVGTRTQCQARATSATQAEIRLNAVLDLLTTDRYLAFPMVGNGLLAVEEVADKGATTGQGESHIIALKGAWVSYEIGGLLGPYETYDPATGENPAATELPRQWVPAAVTLEPQSFVPLPLEIVPPPIGLALDNDAAFNRYGSAGILVAHIVVEGLMADGTVVHSPTFHLPITVCRGCLASWNVNPPDCCRLQEEAGTSPCWPGQDEQTPCQITCLLHGMELGPRALRKLALVSGLAVSMTTDPLAIPNPPDWYTNLIEKAVAQGITP